MRAIHIGKRALFLLLAALTLGAVLSSAAGPEYTLDWWTVDGGGGTLTGGGYTLGGTAGQPDAGVLAGDGYTLSGGFWGGAAAVEHTIFLPLVLRSY